MKRTTTKIFTSNGSKRITKKSRLSYRAPNNPTGTVYSEANTRALVKLALRHNLTLIVDEVYKDFYYGDEQHFSPAMIPEARNNLIRVCSFSKAFAMTGWRVGFLLTTQHYMQKILKFHDAMVTCAPVISQYAAIGALRYGHQYLDEFAKQYKVRRDLTIKKLDEMSLVLDYQMPRATYFLFFLGLKIQSQRPMRLRNFVTICCTKSTWLSFLVMPLVHQVSLIFVSTSVEISMTSRKGLTELVNTSLRRQGGAGHFKRKISNDLQGAKKSSRNVAKKVLHPRCPVGLCSMVCVANKPTVIGIAGTRGKTNYKRSIRSALSSLGKIRSNALSFNTEVGLPMSVLGLEKARERLEKSNKIRDALVRSDLLCSAKRRKFDSRVRYVRSR